MAERFDDRQSEWDRRLRDYANGAGTRAERKALEAVLKQSPKDRQRLRELAQGQGQGQIQDQTPDLGPHGHAGQNAYRGDADYPSTDHPSTDYGGAAANAAAAPRQAPPSRRDSASALTVARTMAQQSAARPSDVDAGPSFAADPPLGGESGRSSPRLDGGSDLQRAIANARNSNRAPADRAPLGRAPLESERSPASPRHGGSAPRAERPASAPRSAAPDAFARRPSAEAPPPPAAETPAPPLRDRGAPPLSADPLDHPAAAAPRRGSGAAAQASLQPRTRRAAEALANGAARGRAAEARLAPPSRDPATILSPRAPEQRPTTTAELTLDDPAHDDDLLRANDLRDNDLRDDELRDGELRDDAAAPRHRAYEGDGFADAGFDADLVDDSAAPGAKPGAPQRKRTAKPAREPKKPRRLGFATAMAATAALAFGYYLGQGPLNAEAPVEFDWRRGVAADLALTDQRSFAFMAETANRSGAQAVGRLGQVLSMDLSVAANPPLGLTIRNVRRQNYGARDVGRIDFTDPGGKVFTLAVLPRRASPAVGERLAFDVGVVGGLSAVEWRSASHVFMIASDASSDDVLRYAHLFAKELN